MDVVVIPMSFGVLFILPILAFIYMANELYSPGACLVVYVFLQISLAISGRMIFG